jgi:phosphoadenosine phosphosulfate reductase
MPLILVEELWPEDIAHWRKMEAQDAAWARTHRLEALSKRAIAVIEGFAARGPCYASVSWGKDSLVLAHLVWSIAESGGPLIPIAWFREEPATNPHCFLVRDQFLQWHQHPYIETKVWLGWSDGRGRYDENLIDEERTESEPIIRRFTSATKEREEGRRCDQRRWWAEWWPQAQEGRLISVTALDPDDDRWSVGRLMGLRAEESSRRRRRMLLGHTLGDSCCPIGMWMARDVFAYLYAHNLPVHPAYAMTFGGRLDRDRLRVSLLGGEEGSGFGREEWEQSYYREAIDRVRRRSKAT